MLSDRSRLLWRVLPVLAGWGLLASCRDSQEKARTVVLEAGFRFTIEDFLRAAADGRGVVVAQFLAVGMNVDAAGNHGETALRVASSGGHAHLVQQLLAAGASADKADADGFTPLMAAATAGDSVSVEALLAAGARMDRVDSKGQTALAAASEAGQAGVVELLVPENGRYSQDVLLLACAGGHTGVIDGLLKADLHGTRARLNWAGLLEAAATGGHLPAVRLLVSRMPPDGEATLARTEGALTARRAGQPAIADFLENEFVRQDGSPPAAAVAGTMQPEASRAAFSDDMGPAAGAHSEPVPLVPHTTPARLGGSRFIRLNCDLMTQVPEVMQMTAWEAQAWPVILQDVAPGHESAEILLTEEPPRTVTLKVGDEIPGTDCVVEKLRRRRLYTDATQSELKNVSELHFRRMGTGEIFQAMAGESVLSNDSSAHLNITGVERVHAAIPGDEFRVGSLLLRVYRIASGAITLENRLTGETVVIPLTVAP